MDFKILIKELNFEVKSTGIGTPNSDSAVMRRNGILRLRTGACIAPIFSLNKEKCKV
jgi:hypothetical protein